MCGSSNVCDYLLYLCVCACLCVIELHQPPPRPPWPPAARLCVEHTEESINVAGQLLCAAPSRPLCRPRRPFFTKCRAAHTALSVRRILRASSSSSIPLFSRTLRLAPDDGNDEHFQSKNWYDALVQKTSLWAEAAEQHPGQLILACDNDITLLPGWDTAVMAAAASLGPEMDLIFQREGGDDPFFDSIPYNSGFFLMRGSHRVAKFWRDVSRRTAVERPFAGDQTIVNSLLHQRGTAAGRPACSAEIALRHAHFPSRLVRGGPTIPESVDALMDVKVHHATASGSAAGKLIALDAFLDAWLNATSHTRARFGWPERGASWLIRNAVDWPRR